MAKPNPTIHLNEPHLGCIPIRPTLITLSILGILGAVISCYNPLYNQFILTIIIFATHCLMLFGAVNYNEFALKLSQHIFLLILVTGIVVTCVLPVTLSCYIASGLGDTHDIMSYTYTAEEFAGGTKDVKIRFKNALIAGLATEFFLICGSALNFIQFVMIRRLKEYVITKNQNKDDSPLVF